MEYSKILLPIILQQIRKLKNHKECLLIILTFLIPKYPKSEVAIKAANVKPGELLEFSIVNKKSSTLKYHQKEKLLVQQPQMKTNMK